MGSIINNFCETFGIDEKQSTKRNENHQLTGSKNSRIEINCTKLSHVFSEHDVTLEGQGSIYNILTKKVLPMDMADQFLQVREILQTKYEEFAKEKLKGERSIWNTIKTERLLLGVEQQSFH